MSITELITCKPISTFEDLLKWPNINNGCRKFSVEKLNEDNLDDEYKNKVLVCHDMKNNYLEDRYLQGFNASDCYSFYHWNLIDTFIYFSHHFITIPPESWINAAHHNNVRMLGTFITEWNDGLAICKQFLYDKQKIDELIAKLVDITLYYGFDGWLINIENKIESILGVENLKYFVKSLTDKLREINPKIYKVIWYDSVIKTGELKWQNELNELNQDFFNVSDGLFVNYTWKTQNLKNTKEMSGNRHRDVYVGVDVFGRGCLGNGGFNCNVAFEEIRKYDLGVALFAPGWLHECNDPKEFIQNSEKFWDLLKEFTSARRLNKLPIITTFNHGSAKEFFFNGKSIPFGGFRLSNPRNSNGWFDLNLQSLLPVISNQKFMNWCFDDAFFGGNCLNVKESKNPIKLFDLNLELNKNNAYLIEYTFKINHETNNRVALNENKRQKTDAIFYLSLGYYSKDLNCVKTLNLNEEVSNNDDLKLDLIRNDCSNASEWKNSKFRLTIKSNTIKCENILIHFASHEGNNTIKLGKFGFMNENEISQRIDSISSSAECDYRLKKFHLEKRVYLNIDLNWRPSSNSNKLYLVFIDENQNKPNDEAKHEFKFRMLGTTKVERFLTCLKLNENFKIDLGAQQGLSFNIFIKPIDSNLSNINNGDIEADETIIKAKIVAKFVRQHSNEAELDFIDNVVYDYENFN